MGCGFFLGYALLSLLEEGGKDGLRRYVVFGVELGLDERDADDGVFAYRVNTS